MRQIYAVLAWGIIILGVVHMLATFRLGALTMSTLWFFDGGVVLVLTGALNLLNRTYGASARGLRWCCVGTNVTTMILSLVAGIVGHASGGQVVTVVGWFAATTLVSQTRAAAGAGRESGAV